MAFMSCAFSAVGGASAHSESWLTARASDTTATARSIPMVVSTLLVSVMSVHPGGPSARHLGALLESLDDQPQHQRELTQSHRHEQLHHGALAEQGDYGPYHQHRRRE